MGRAHEGLAITDGEFDAIAEHLEGALREFEVEKTDREAVMTAVEGFREDVVEA